MPYKGFNPVAFARSSATTLAHHIRDVESAFMRNFQIGAILESNGRVNYNNGGEGFDWPVQYRIHNLEGNTGQTNRNFSQRNLWKTAYLEFRGYQATDSMYYREFLSNRGPEGIVKVYDQFTQRIEKSVKQALGTEYYVNGNAADKNTSWHGFETMFDINDGTNDQTIQTGTFPGTARTANAADINGYPNGTYAGLSMVLGNYNGDNEASKTWPEGLADPQFDFWSPLVTNANTTDSGFAGATNDWVGQGDEILRYAIITAQRNSSLEGQITNVVMSRDYYMKFLNLIDDKERMLVTSETQLRALGFKNVVNFDGIECSWEVGVPSSTAYGYNYNMMELKSMDTALLRSEGPVYDIDSQAFNAVVSTLSNLKFASPRNCFKIADLT